MKNTNARVHLSLGEFILSQNAQGHLAWTSASGTQLSPPETGAVLLWDGCVDQQGEFHLFIHTTSRHLMHCHTADGRHWQRRSLLRLDREDIELQDLCVRALPELTLIYLLSGAEQKTAAIRYTQTPQGSWQGRRLELPDTVGSVSLAALLPTRESGFLYTAHNDANRSRIFRIALTSSAAQEICSIPGPIVHPQLLQDEQGQLHTLFLHRDEAFADGYPLLSKVDTACLYERNHRVYCACRQAGQWYSFGRTSDSWEKEEQTFSDEIHLEIASGIHQFAPTSAAAAPKAIPSTPPDASGILRTLHNQAVLLSSLQESFRELQQQHFVTVSQVKALEAQVKAIPALKDRCARLEQAMEALEALCSSLTTRGS